MVGDGIGELAAILFAGQRPVSDIKLCVGYSQARSSEDIAAALLQSIKRLGLDVKIGTGIG